MAVLAGAVVYVSRRRRVGESTPVDRQRAAAFLLLGCAATLPLAISPKQSGHYIVPAMPMFALGLGALIVFGAEPILQSAGVVRWIGRITVLLFVAAFAAGVVRWAIPWRDAARLRDLDRVFSVVPARTTLHLCPAAQTDWSLHAYAQRLWRASLDIRHPARRWGIATAAGSCVVPDGCRVVPTGTTTLLLYECGTYVSGRHRP
jgi:hypothetical protein